MGIRSKWAYNNGKRIMRECLAVTCEEWGFIDGKYAERHGNKLSVKTYANRRQADTKCDKLNESGLSCAVSERWPYVILATVLK